MSADSIEPVPAFIARCGECGRVSPAIRPTEELATEDLVSHCRIVHDREPERSPIPPADQCPYCGQRAQMEIDYNISIGPCPLHACPEPTTSTNGASA